MTGAPASPSGSREPSPSGLGPSGFDPSRWQPIETVPEHGIFIVARYEMPRGWWRDFGVMQRLNDGRWISVFDHAVPDPTHWMPLPDNPGDAA